MLKAWALQLASAASAETIEICVLDDIGAGMGPGCVTAQHVINALNAQPDAKTVKLRINSNGGLMKEAVAMWNILAERAAGGVAIEAHIDGLAASAGAYLTTVASRVVMPDNAWIMIHKSSAFTGGNDTDMENARKRLAATDELMADAFASASARRDKGKTKEDFLTEMRKGDRYFSAKEAVEWGLADEIIKSIRVAAHSVTLEGHESAPDALRAAPYVLVQTERTPSDGGQQAKTAGEVSTMDLKILAKMLGLPENATADEVSAELTKRLEPQANVNTSGMLKMLGVATEVEASAKIQDFQRSVLQLLGATGKATTAEAMAAALEWKAKADQVDGLTKHVATLTEETRVSKRDGAIERLSREGQLPPARHEWARAHFQTAEQVDTFCAGMPKGFFSAINEPEHEGEALALTAEEKGVCKILGMSEAKYLEEKKLLRKAG